MAEQIPMVDYLVLDDGEPHLVAHECTNCGARFFDSRNACAKCFATEFTTVPIATEGTVRAFTIVTFAAPGIPTPFVASVVDCDGTQVRANLTNVEPDPEHVRTGMKVRLTTYSLGDGLRRHRGRRVRVRARRVIEGEQTMSASDEVWILGIKMTKFGKHLDLDAVDLAAEAATGALARRRRHDGRHRDDRGRQPDERERQRRPTVAEADRPDRHTRVQRRERMRHRCDRVADGDHGRQGRRSRLRLGGRCRKARGRRASRCRRQEERRRPDVDAVGSIRRGDAGRRADRHRDDAGRLRPDRHGVRPQVRRCELRALRKDQRKEPRAFDAQSAGGILRSGSRWTRS